MKSISNIDMGEVTRLTRLGKLSEAIALLQGGRGKTSTTEASVNHASSDVQTEPPSGSTRPQGTRFENLRANLVGAGTVLGQRVEVVSGPRYEERTFANAFGSRAYKIFIPSRYACQPVPLIVMLHGCTQSPDDFAVGTRMNELAEEQTFLVAYPAQSQSANAQKCWNWFNTADQGRERGEPSLIAGICKQIIQELSVDLKRVYVAGLSAGGAAAAVMATNYPDLFAAVGIHSGLACGAARDIISAFAAMQGSAVQPRSKSRVPAIVFHGDSDKTVHPNNADQLIAQALSKERLQKIVTHAKSPGGMNYTRTVQTREGGPAFLEQWILHGAGHAWSGGSPNGSFTEPRGPDASREMVRFFFSQQGP